MADNMKMTVKGNELIIRIDLSEKGELTAKGTTRKIAGTAYWEKVEGQEGLSMNFALLRSVKAKAPKASKVEDDADENEEKPARKVSSKNVTKTAKTEKEKPKAKGKNKPDTEDDEIPAAKLKKKRAA